jgi:hypothetical protein
VCGHFGLFPYGFVTNVTRQFNDPVMHLHPNRPGNDILLTIKLSNDCLLHLDIVFHQVAPLESILKSMRADQVRVIRQIAPLLVGDCRLALRGSHGRFNQQLDSRRFRIMSPSADTPMTMRSCFDGSSVA